MPQHRGSVLCGMRGAVPSDLVLLPPGAVPTESRRHKAPRAWCLHGTHHPSPITHRALCLHGVCLSDQRH